MSNAPEYDDHSLAHSMTDLMTSLAVIFILLLVIYLNHTFQEAQQGSMKRLEAIKKELDKALVAQSIECEMDENKDPLSCTIRLRDDKLQFALNSSDLASRGKTFLSWLTPRLTGVLCSDDYKNDVESVFIRGFTDSTGDDNSNLKLSAERSFQVLSYSLNSTSISIDKRNCFLDMASTSGRGERELITLADGTENQDASRRVEFKIRVKSYELRKNAEDNALDKEVALLGRIKVNSNQTKTMSYSDVLDQLDATADFCLKLAYEPVKPELFKSKLVEVELMSQSDASETLSATVRQSAIGKWAEVKETQKWDKLTRREIRDLISIQEIFEDTSLISVVKLQLPFNKRLLSTVLRSYLSYWKTLGERRRPWLEMIQVSIDNSAFDKRLWPALRHWRDSKAWLLSSSADKELAYHLSDTKGPYSEALKHSLMIEISLSENSIADAARTHLLEGVLISEWSSSERLERVQQALSYWVNPKADHKWLGDLIRHVHELGSSQLVEYVKNWFLRHPDFLDPRLNRNNGWYYLPSEARKVFTSWLSKEDLEFFFKMVLDDRNDPHKRREFWEQYLPCVIGSRVLLSDADRTRNRSKLNEMKQEGITLPGSIRGSSVFIMETEECYILEFSEVGNAAYIYWKKSNRITNDVCNTLSKILIHKSAGHSANELKLGRAVEELSLNNSCLRELNIRCRHSSNWQENLMQWLRAKGIRP